MKLFMAELSTNFRNRPIVTRPCFILNTLSIYSMKNAIVPGLIGRVILKHVDQIVCG